MERVRADWKRYVVGLVFGVGTAVLLAVAGTLTEIESLGDIDPSGLAVVAIRAAATAIAAVLGVKVAG